MNPSRYEPQFASKCLGKYVHAYSNINIYIHIYPRLRQQPATALGTNDDDYSDDVAADFDDDDNDVTCITSSIVMLF